MLQQRIQAVKAHFHSYHLNVTDSWLDECITWAVENQPPEERHPAKLRDFAYQQWLLADLRQVGRGCLPPNLEESRCTILRGKYTLQIEQIVDIANSKYNQIKVIRGGELVSEQPVEVEPSSELSEWGQGPKENSNKLRQRKLKLFLCDGKLDIKGLEYRNLPTLQGTVLAGSKVLITGPVECRRGILMLEPRHFQLLNGEVDTMFVPNAFENILARCLGLPENKEPYKDGQNVLPEPRKQDHAPRRVATARTLLSSSANPVARDRAANRTSSTVNRVAPCQPGNNAARSNSPGSGQNRPPPATSVLRQNIVYQRPEEQAFEEDDMVDFDYEGLMRLEMESTRELTLAQSQSKERVNIGHPHSVSSSGVTLFHSSMQHRNTSSETNWSNMAEDDMGDDFSYQDLDSIFQQEQQAVQSSATELGNMSDLIEAGNEAGSTRNEQRDSFSTSNGSHIRNLTSSPVNLRNQHASLRIDSHAQPPTKKMKSSLIEHEDCSTSIGRPSNLKVSAKPNLSKFVQSYRASTSPPVQGLRDLPSAPFIYLQQLKMSCNRPHRVLVKACVVTLLQKLKSLNGTWKLELRINDGSASLDVEFSNEVLVSIIGFNVQEYEALKTQAKGNSLVKEKLIEAMHGLQKKLIELICLMEIEWPPDGTACLARVVQLKPLDKSHLNQLRARK